MLITDADPAAMPPEWTEKAHLASLAALRSATILRLVKAALLLAVAGVLVSAVVVPLCLDRPRAWFGMEFGPARSADGRVPMMVEPSKALEDGLTNARDVSSVLYGLQRRIELIDGRIALLERRCLIEGRPITIARDSPLAPASVPSRVAVLEVQPMALNEYGAMTSFGERWVYPQDLETPQVILRGTPVDTTELRFELTWIGGDGATIGRASPVFTRTAGRWDKLAQSAQCAGVNPSTEALGKFRIQISNQ